MQSIPDEIQARIIRLATQCPAEFAQLLSIDVQETAALEDEISDARQELADNQFVGPWGETQRMDAALLVNWADDAHAIARELAKLARDESVREAA